MTGWSNFKFNLGIPQLLPEWKSFFSTKYLAADIIAGITVAFIAIPLSLAIALASGVAPNIGLVTAIVAGIICALFGGTPLAVSGPAAAMSVLLADIVEKFGFPALVLMCLIVGVMQLVSGIIGIGRLARYVPLPVVAGFTAGIGVIIIIGQLPRAFGLEPPPESHVFDVLRHIKDYLHQINGACIFIVIITIACIRGLPKVLPRVPPILPAVVLATCIVYFFNLESIPLIGAIPRSLPAPTLPNFAINIPITDLLFTSFIVYLLASLETLLSSSAVDKLSTGKKHDSNQELIGQGLGNLATSLFGGIPITGVIARSAINVRAGAKTRRSSIIHSLIILVTVYFAAPLIGLIPVAALAGVLFNVAYSMVNYREFHRIWVTTRYEAAIYAITFFTIVFVDLLAGVQAGIIAAAIILLIRATKTHLNISTSSHDGVVRISCTGPLTFLSTGRINNLQQKLEADYPGQIVILDLSNIRNLDASGATAVIDLYQHLASKNIKFYIQGLPRRFEPIFKLAEGSELLRAHSIISEQELREKEAQSAPKSAHGRLIHGVQKFYAERQHNDKRLFQYIAKQQNPHTLFIACSDSRVIPSQITSADPGELFIIRNIGNFIPPFETATDCSESAALEFALSSFDITDIVICGHANCGAIKACLAPSDKQFPLPLKNWIDRIKTQLVFQPKAKLPEIIQQNALNQIANLQKYPIVQSRLAEGTLTIHVWFFDFNQSLVYEWDKKTREFKCITTEMVE